MNLIEYQLDGRVFPSLRSEHSDLEVEIVMDSPRLLETQYITQFPMLVDGGHDLLIQPLSPTADNWYDSGAEITIISSKIWNEIDQDSRTRLRSVTINGEEDLVMSVVRQRFLLLLRVI